MADYCTFSNALASSGITFAELGFATQEALNTFGAKLVTRASRVIDRFCNVPNDYFNGGATITAYEDGKPYPSDVSYIYTERGDEGEEDRSLFILGSVPVISITSIHRNTAEIGDSEVWVEVTKYRINKNMGRLILAASQTPDEGTDNLRIIYVAGYSTLPSEVEMACEELVSNTLQIMNKNQLNAKIRYGRASNVTTQPSIELTDAVKQMLQPYQSRSV